LVVLDILWIAAQAGELTLTSPRQLKATCRSRPRPPPEPQIVLRRRHPLDPGRLLTLKILEHPARDIAPIRSPTHHRRDHRHAEGVGMIGLSSSDGMRSPADPLARTQILPRSGPRGDEWTGARLLICGVKMGHLG